MDTEAKTIEVNYRRKKHYKTARYPIRQPKFWTWLILVLSKMMLIGKKYKIEKTNVDDLKPPYFMLSNHMHFIDFELGAIATYPHKVNNVISIDGYYRRPWLMRWIGGIATRRFTMDLHLIKSINKVFKNGDVLSMYPEAKFSPIGTTSYIPGSLGKIIKLNKMPVVVVTHHGNYLRAPVWCYAKKRKVPLLTKMTKILTPEQIKEMSVDEINEIVKKALSHDEYQYQKENNILIKEPFRAEGLHKVLYQCPNCKTESKMASKGAEIFCTHCGKRWVLNEDGSLSAKEGKTEFPHIPDWYEWEREQVRDQILKGEYKFEDDVTVFSFPTCWRFVPLGKAKLRHTPKEGFVLEGHYNKQDYRIQKLPIEMLALHVEYDYWIFKNFDCLDISTSNDSFYCYPTKQNVITKLNFATEELYKIALEKSAKKEK